jgi:guanosine-3',5'-bis(diphosphate) 3'-pyrophosphohydrolase
VPLDLLVTDISPNVDVPKERVLISQLLDATKKYLDLDAQKSIYEAYLFGAIAHQDQIRKSGEAYIHHPLAVALILANMQIDSRTLIAAILHDVLEDTDISRKELAEEFGEDIAHLVDGVSKITQISSSNAQHAEAESFRKMLLAMAKDVRVILIKLADRLHNMHTLEHLPDEKRKRIARQTLEIYAPIANRLGMRELTADLEDLCFKALYPVRYKAISDRLNSDTRGRKPIESQIINRLQERFEKLGIGNAKVAGRKKRVYSIYQKIKHRGVSAKSQKDIHGIRIIVESRDDCYRALGVVHQEYTPMLHTVKDYIGMPKSNGYQSLHTVVIGPHGLPVEVQIRTVEMDRVAETGVASHWIYKSNGKDSRKQPQQIIKKMLDSFQDMQGQVGDAGHFMEHLRAEMYPDKLFVFTPKGDIKRLPVGATPVDFAYSVHSAVGNRCVGCRIDGEVSALNTVLDSGNRVEIVTSRTGRPLPSWLNFVVTSKARTTIRHFLSQQQDKEAISIGRRLLTKALRDSGYTRNRIASENKVKLLELFKLEDWNKLLADIGFGKRLPLMVAHQLISMTELGDSKKYTGSTSSLSIRGTENLLIHYANCCYPVPGDDIIGVFVADKGMVVHRDGCPNTRRYRKHIDRWLHLDWGAKTKGKFKSKLRIVVNNTPGVLAQIAQLIAEESSNITKVEMPNEEKNLAHMEFEIEVNNHAHLQKIMLALGESEYVFELERVGSPNGKA